MTAAETRWNHSTHYLPLLVDAVRPGCTAIDLGCGEGHTVRSLVAAGAGHVTGVDSSAEMLDLAREATPAGAPAEFLEGDLLTVPEARRFDVVACVATLHHVPLEAGLARLRDLTAPGGRLVVIGLAQPSSPWDLCLSLASVVAHRAAARHRGYWEHPAPVTEFTETVREVRSAASRLLPGSRLRSRLYWRYTLEWVAPA